MLSGWNTFQTGNSRVGKVEIPLSDVTISGNIRISSYLNESYQVEIHEIDRGYIY